MLVLLENFNHFISHLETDQISVRYKESLLKPLRGSPHGNRFATAGNRNKRSPFNIILYIITHHLLKTIIWAN